MTSTYMVERLANILLNEMVNLPYDTFITTIPVYDIPTYNNLSNTNTNDIETIINYSFNQKSKYKQVICDEELNKLINSKIKYQIDNNNNNICPITQTEFEEQQEIIKLECGHLFSSEAIIHWLTEEKSECPVCRFKYKSKEIKNIEQTTNLYNDDINFNMFFIQ